MLKNMKNWTNCENWKKNCKPHINFLIGRKRECEICKADYGKNSLILDELVKERTNLEKMSRQLQGRSKKYIQFKINSNQLILRRNLFRKKMNRIRNKLEFITKRFTSWKRKWKIWKVWFPLLLEMNSKVQLITKIT